MQQDAHEFLNYLLNAISETLTEEKRREQMNGAPKANGPSKKSTAQANDLTKFV
jgi:ubiquitin C-terminal hydrolase